MAKTTLALPDTHALLAALRDDGGFTFDPYTGRMIGRVRGWAIGIPGTEVALSDPLSGGELRERVGELLALAGDLAQRAYVGGWRGPSGPIVELSTIERVSRVRALAIGRVRSQLAVRDMTIGRDVPVPPRLARGDRRRAAG